MLASLDNEDFPHCHFMKEALKDPEVFQIIFLKKKTLANTGIQKAFSAVLTCKQKLHKNCIDKLSKEKVVPLPTEKFSVTFSENSKQKPSTVSSQPAMVVSGRT